MVLLPCIFLSSLAAASIIDDSGSSSSPLLSRDSSSSSSNQLPVQVGGIVASYIIFDALVVCLLLFVGRRLRRAVQASNYTLEVVMIQPGKITASTDPSPISGDISFPSPVQSSSRGGWNMSWSSMAKHHKGGHASTNNSVTTVDESVVSADKRRAQEEMEFLYAAVMEHDARKAASSANSSPVLENEQQVTTFSPLGSPVESPLHSPHLFPPPRPEPQPQYQAQYQAQHQYQTPLSPRQGSTTTTTNKSRTSQRLSRISNLSIFSPSRLSSNSNKLKSPRSIRDLPISPPVRSPDVARTATFDSSAPLSPRMYTPGPPPLAPLSTASSSTPKPVPASFALQPISPQSTPRSNAPAPLSITSSNTMLPFRQQFNPPLSAPPTKTTILERPLHVPGGPRTGMPTPYSPYMPFTPVTPLTPSRFVTKREKRMKDKSNGLRVLHEDDMVKGDDEMWGT